ncbi:MAG: hypothetical protein Q9222_003404 [Ikaeria aurantiellina]
MPPLTKQEKDKLTTQYKKAQEKVTKWLSKNGSPNGIETATTLYDTQLIAFARSVCRKKILLPDTIEKLMNEVIDLRLQVLLDYDYQRPSSESPYKNKSHSAFIKTFLQVLTMLQVVRLQHGLPHIQAPATIPPAGEKSYYDVLPDSAS